MWPNTAARACMQKGQNPTIKGTCEPMRNIAYDAANPPEQAPDAAA